MGIAVSPRRGETAPCSSEKGEARRALCARLSASQGNVSPDAVFTEDIKGIVENACVARYPVADMRSNLVRFQNGNHMLFVEALCCTSLISLLQTASCISAKLGSLGS